MLVTGGLGFIGSNLCRRLVAEGAKVTLVDSLVPTHGGNRFNIAGLEDRVDCRIQDIGESTAMAPLLRETEYLFNLAGQTSHMDSMADPERDLESNVHAHLALLECCRRENSRLKVVFASTRQIYGRPARLPVDESHAISPVDVNGIHKYAGERYHMLYNDVYGIRACALRLTNTYGPRMRVRDARQTFLGVWIRSLIEGRPIDVFGDGSQLRDFTYVDDCVEALVRAALSERANGRVYNLGSSEVVSLRDVAEILVGLGHGGTYQTTPFPTDHKAIDIGSYCGDFSLISSELGWKPAIDLRTGLERTVEYYKVHGAKYWESAP